MVIFEADYSSFRAARLMLSIGDRFIQRRPRTAQSSSSHRASTARGGGRASRGIHSGSSSRASSSCAVPASSSMPPPPRPSMPSAGHLRVPPSIDESTGPVNPILAHMRFQYQVAYVDPGFVSYALIPVAAPDRSLPIAQITEVTKMIC